VWKPSVVKTLLSVPRIQERWTYSEWSFLRLASLIFPRADVSRNFHRGVQASRAKWDFNLHTAPLNETQIKKGATVTLMSSQSSGKISELASL
jgi:hypothetical protein